MSRARKGARELYTPHFQSVTPLFVYLLIFETGSHSVPQASLGREASFCLSLLKSGIMARLSQAVLKQKQTSVAQINHNERSHASTKEDHWEGGSGAFDLGGGRGSVSE